MPNLRSFLVPALVVAALVPALARAGISVEGPLVVDKIARPGEGYRGTIAVRNTGREPIEVKLYQTDYTFSADGSNDFAPPGSTPRSNARWVRLGQQQFLIAAGAMIHAPYEVNVPDDTRLAGSYWSTVMVEPLAARESTTRGGKPGVQVAQVIRYAVQIATDIGATGRRTLAFVNPLLARGDSGQKFSVDIENTGDHYLRPQLWMELYDNDGRRVGKIDSAKKRVYPGTSARFVFDLSKVARGRHRALIVADGGDDDLFGTEFSFELK